jgi:hypothetical protein
VPEEACSLLAGHGEHAVRIIRPQHRLVGAWESRQVGQVSQVAGVHLAFVEHLSVRRDVLPGMPQRPAQPLELQGAQLVDGGSLDRLQVVGPGRAVLHGKLLSHA